MSDEANNELETEVKEVGAQEEFDLKLEKANDPDEIRDLIESVESDPSEQTEDTPPVSEKQEADPEELKNPVFFDGAASTFNRDDKESSLEALAKGYNELSTLNGSHSQKLDNLTRENDLLLREKQEADILLKNAADALNNNTASPPESKPELKLHEIPEDSDYLDEDNYKKLVENQNILKEALSEKTTGFSEDKINRIIDSRNNAVIAKNNEVIQRDAAVKKSVYAMQKRFPDFKTELDVFDLDDHKDSPSYESDRKKSELIFNTFKDAERTGEQFNLRAYMLNKRDLDGTLGQQAIDMVNKAKTDALSVKNNRPKLATTLSDTVSEPGDDPAFIKEESDLESASIEQLRAALGVKNDTKLF